MCVTDNVPWLSSEVPIHQCSCFGNTIFQFWTTNLALQLAGKRWHLHAAKHSKSLQHLRASPIPGSSPRQIPPSDDLAGQPNHCHCIHPNRCMRAGVIFACVATQAAHLCNFQMFCMQYKFTLHKVKDQRLSDH
jgi:hypothetical protein